MIFDALQLGRCDEWDEGCDERQLSSGTSEEILFIYDYIDVRGIHNGPGYRCTILTWRHRAGGF